MIIPDWYKSYFESFSNSNILGMPSISLYLQIPFLISILKKSSFQLSFQFPLSGEFQFQFESLLSHREWRVLLRRLTREFGAGQREKREQEQSAVGSRLKFSLKFSLKARTRLRFFLLRSTGRRRDGARGQEGQEPE